MASSTEQYDFVIIGGGTAGLVLAARLTEDPNLHVLVLEAGENHISNPQISIPALWPSLLGSDLDWNFSTEPQQELKNRKIGIPHGRVLGGSSALNAQAFIGPSKVGLDLWKEFGNPLWDWAVMEKYYEKSYNVGIPSEEIREHLGLGYLKDKPGGQHGPLQLSFPDSKEDPIAKTWIDTLAALNYKITEDPLSGASTGAFVHPSTVNGATKERSYSATAYYLPAQNRKNLHLITGAQVEKILFNTSSGVAIASGVKFLKNGSFETVRANKEVILAAGALHSPKILELSGIGGSALLKSKGIEVIVENKAVGENFHDHPMVNHPIIDPAYYSNPLDLEILARHIGFIEKIVATEPLASLLKTGGIRSPDFAKIGDDLDAAKEYIRRTTISGWHPVGTCAMKSEDAGGVVNERLVVYGTKNLRVVDASIMPFICRGNTQSTVYAVAERAADIIKEDFNVSN